MKKINKWFSDNLEWLVVVMVGITCAGFLIAGNPTEDGTITLDAKPAQIQDYTKDFIESSNEALARIMSVDAPTDEATIEANDEPMGQGFYVDIATILARIEADGNNDGGKGWQCSKYTAYLATGKRQYSASNPDFGPVNGKDVAGYLVKNYGFKYIDQPVKGAIGSGGFNTQFGHTAVYLYATGSNTAMVNDANYTPLTVSTHNMNIDGWVWVVPGNYEPTPTPTPTPTPEPTPEPISPVDENGSYVVKHGDTLGGIALKMGWCNGCKLFGDDGLAQELAEKNGIENRGVIYPGMVINR